MEPLGVFLDEEWDSPGRMLSTDGKDFMVQLHGRDGRLGFWLSSEGNANNGGSGLGLDQSLLHSSGTLSSNFHYFPIQNSNGSASDYQLSYCQNVQETNCMFESMDLCIMNMMNNSLGVPALADDMVEGLLCLKEETNSEVAADPGNGMHIKRKLNNPKLDIEAQDNQINANTSENPKKRSRISRDAQKSKKNGAAKESHEKLIANGNDEEVSNLGPNGQSFTCCSSEDDPNSKGSAVLNLNGKIRATRGSATDPQSLYARKRRERINERMKVLQTLVPNGTKVDISTMLEEAVHYVKFLQLQIKLLSSDDLWMYAPLAYNGVDISMYQKISSAS